MSDTPTPRTDAIRKCIRDAIHEPDHERQIALRDGAENGIERLERELAAALARAEKAEARVAELEEIVRDMMAASNKALSQYNEPHVWSPMSNHWTAILYNAINAARAKVGP